jgi:hypothetical protein
MPPLSLPVLQFGKPTVWEEAIYAFLVEKRGRSGSTRTVESYARMLWPFFRTRTPDQVRAADILASAWDRCLGTGAVIDDGRRADRLSLLLLPVPDQDGPPDRQPL